ncbi:MAG: MBL fold metallo-hydrolase [Thermoproteota archaeon]
MKLTEIDIAKVTCLVDDHVNLLLPNTPVAHRPPLRESWYEKPPIGVHGFSVAITIEVDDTKHRILFDAGLSPWAASYNVDAIDFDLSYCEMVILSHGHIDHAGGLHDIRKKMNSPSIPLIVHSDAFKNRLFKFQQSTINLPPPNRSSLVQAGYNIIEKNQPSVWLNGSVLVTGEIPRTNDFERGLSNHYSNENGKVESEPLISDDQAIVLNIKDKGLVIITGCAHSGIINTINYAKKLTGEDNIYAVLGGMHLEGKAFETIIPRTIDELKKQKPKFVIPCHCTGFYATNEMANRMLNSDMCL